MPKKRGGERKLIFFKNAYSIKKIKRRWRQTKKTDKSYCTARESQYDQQTGYVWLDINYHPINNFPDQHYINKAL